MAEFRELANVGEWTATPSAVPLNGSRMTSDASRNSAVLKQTPPRGHASR